MFPLSFSFQRARHPMLLLSGPPGCGKTATIHALAQDMGFSVLEWVNPTTEGTTSSWKEGLSQLLLLTLRAHEHENYRQLAIAFGLYTDSQTLGCTKINLSTCRIFLME